MTTSRLCGCSFVRPGLSFVEGLEWVQRHGFNHADVAVGGAHAHASPIVVAENPQKFAAQLTDTAHRLELRLNECFTLNFGWPINCPDAARRNETRRLFVGLCRFAAASHFVSILLIPGPVHPELGAEKSLDLAVSALGELVKVAADHGLRLHMEADMDSCANTPETADELCIRTHGLFLTLDYSHFVCQDIEADRIMRLHPHTRHLHIRQAAPGRLVAPVTEGSIDFGRVLRQLATAGYQGLYCIEYLGEEPEARTRAMIEYLSGFNQCLQPD